MTIEYQPGKLNATMDSLSRKAQLVALEEDELLVPMGSQVQVFTDLQEKIKEGLHKDPTTLNIMKQVKEGKTRKFWMDNGFCTLVMHLCA
jgi:hypothetical protein